MTKYIILLASLLLLAFSSARAQKYTSEIPESAMDDMFRKFQEIQQKRQSEIEYEKALEKLVDEMIIKLNAWLSEVRRSEAQMRRDFQQQYQYKPGEMDLFPLFEEIPGPVPTLPDAARVNFEIKYGAYIAKVEMQKKQLSDMMQQHLGDQRHTESQVMADSKTMANRNAFVQQMGGADALMQMSEAERKAMAKKIKDNPAAFSGVQDAGMNAMMQQMISDPAYREKYNKMTDAQKLAEMQKFRSSQVVERNDAAFEAGLKEKNQAAGSMQVQALLAKTLNNMQLATGPFNEGTTIANEFYGSAYRQIEGWYNKVLATLPEVVMGETRVKQGQGQLDKCKAILRYAVQKKEAATRSALWNDLKVSTKMAIGEFNSFIGAYGWGKGRNASLVSGTYMEPQVAAAVNSIYDQMIQFANGAEKLTRMHKGQQEQYETIINID